MDVNKKKILIVGLGRSGLSAARWLSRKGADVTVSDVKDEKNIDHGLLNKARDLDIRLETGGHVNESFVDSDLIVVSPGVPLDIAPLKLADENGIPIIGEMEMAMGIIDTPMAAITGTNGKTTSVSLLGCMVEKSGAKVFVGGNIGTPLMDYAAGDQSADYAVVEVSSFQLDSIKTMAPLVSLILNITPDHLDRYPGYDAYVDSKLRIFQDQGRGQFAILNDDDERLSKIRQEDSVTFLRYGSERKSARHAFLQENGIMTVLPGPEGIFFSTEKFKLKGKHNLENLMGVILAALALGLPTDAIQNGIDSFEALSHRMEPVGVVNGVSFVNDSKATNVDSAARAIEGIAGPVVLIGGGRHKYGDYAPLVEAAKGKVKKVILMGEASNIMSESFEGVIPYSMAESMEEAVNLAYSSAHPGDVILLAPACSSFDMFRDYGHRGRVFTDAVERFKNGK